MFDCDGMGYGYGGIGSVFDVGFVSLFELLMRGCDVYVLCFLWCIMSVGFVVVVLLLG